GPKRALESETIGAPSNGSFSRVGAFDFEVGIARLEGVRPIVRSARKELRLFRRTCSARQSEAEFYGIAHVKEHTGRTADRHEAPARRNVRGRGAMHFVIFRTHGELEMPRFPGRRLREGKPGKGFCVSWKEIIAVIAEGRKIAVLRLDSDCGCGKKSRFSD